MGDLTANFSKSEFSCRCSCGFERISMDTVRICQAVRDFFDKPVTVTSGCRCESHNANVGGSKSSQHLQGTAADIVVKDIKPSLVYEYLDENADELGVGGLGSYDTFTHVDTSVGISFT